MKSKQNSATRTVWNRKSFELHLTEIVAFSAGLKPSSILRPIKPKELNKALHDKMMLLKQHLLTDDDKEGFCGKMSEDVPISLIDTFIDKEILEFDAKGKTVANRDPAYEIGHRSKKLLSNEFNCSQEGKLLMSWMMDCFRKGARKVRQHGDIWKNRTARYLGYGAALKNSNVWREQCLDDLEHRLPQEMRDLVTQALVVENLPPILAYHEDANDQVFPDPGQKSGRLDIPAYLHRTDTLDTMTRFLLQGLGEVTLVSGHEPSPPSASTTYSGRQTRSGKRIGDSGETQSVAKIGRDYSGRDPGYVVDITNALTLLAPSIRNSILACISLAHPPIFQRAAPGQCNVNLLPTLAPAAATIKHLDLTFKLPFFHTDGGFYPSQIYLAQDGVPTLKDSLSSLSSLRLTILESDDRDLRLTRGQYMARGFNKGNTTLQAEMQTLIARFRLLDIKYRLMVFVNEDGKPRSEHLSWRVGISGMDLHTMDGTGLKSDEMAKRLMETENVEHLV